jgi:hypothetical protein
MVHTDSATYWQPTKPRINIYGFTDTTYSSPLYTYNAFTDSGNVDKPLALSFESQTTTAGTFSLEIDNSADSLDPDMFLRGNRVVIECSKDNSTWQTAFKGLVRSGKQKIFAVNNRTISIEGYSYLIRLTERILSFKKQAALIAGQTYDRNDSTMFSNNLLNDILTNDLNYMHSIDDTALYSVFKTANITSSPINDFVPRIDAPLATLSDTINSVLEFSQSLLTMDFSNDQLVLFNPDRVPSTGGAGIFLLTDSMNQQADDASYTMYPVSDYTYQISYDYPDAGNRLIGSIGSGECPPVEVPGTPGSGGVDTSGIFNFTGQFAFHFTNNGDIKYGGLFNATTTPIKRIRIGAITVGAPTGSLRNKWQAQLLDYTLTYGSQGFYLYPESQTTGYGDPALDIKTAASGVLSAKYAMTTQASTQTALNQSTLPTDLWLVVWMDPSVAMDNNNRTAWGYIGSGTGEYIGYDDFNQLVYHAGTAHAAQFQIETFQGTGTPTVPTGGTPPTTIQPCGGLPEASDSDNVLMIASDRNSGKRLGMVEQTVTNMPVHVKNFASMNEYLYNKLYTVAKPHFNFDYPSVTVPTTLPKGGDICCHVSKKAQVGRARTPLQMGVIASVQYNFGQDSDSVLGLRRLSIATTGILRGSY